MLWLGPGVTLHCSHCWSIEVFNQGCPISTSRMPKTLLKWDWIINEKQLQRLLPQTNAQTVSFVFNCKTNNHVQVMIICEKTHAKSWTQPECGRWQSLLCMSECFGSMYFLLILVHFNVTGSLHKVHGAFFAWIKHHLKLDTAGPQKEQERVCVC